jgi:DNA uptake protein ComE-like DNA-binding protein
MKPRKTEYLLKSYFYFNKQERKGIMALLLLILLMLIIPHVFRVMFPPKQLDFRWESVDEQKVQLSTSNWPMSNSQKQVANSLYPVSKGQQIVSNKRLLQYPVELNSADSETLVALYRIGPGLAHRILEYREQLGGFVSLEQLTEIWGFDEDILFDLKGKISVNPKKAKRYQVNTVTYEQLSSHPYFKYKLSKAIVNYRTQHGAFASLEELKKVVIVNDSVFKRIARYLYF